MEAWPLACSSSSHPCSIPHLGWPRAQVCQRPTCRPLGYAAAEVCRHGQTALGRQPGDGDWAGPGSGCLQVPTVWSRSLALQIPHTERAEAGGWPEGMSLQCMAQGWLPRAEDSVGLAS